MKSNCIVVAVFLNIMYVDNRMLPSPYYKLVPSMETFVTEQERPKAKEQSNEKMISLENNSEMVNADSEESFSYGKGNVVLGPEDKCAILVMSNQGHTTLHQSLKRKYRYNKDGDLIPSSVQYFIKFPREGGEILVPLKDKAFSPTGGFVRYYKEIPPIPQSWKR